MNVNFGSTVFYSVASDSTADKTKEREALWGVIQNKNYDKLLRDNLNMQFVTAFDDSSLKQEAQLDQSIGIAERLKIPYIKLESTITDVKVLSELASVFKPLFKHHLEKETRRGQSDFALKEINIEG